MKHNHMTRDIKAPGKCPGCDEYWKKAERVVDSVFTADDLHQIQAQDR